MNLYSPFFKSINCRSYPTFGVSDDWRNLIWAGKTRFQRLFPKQKRRLRLHNPIFIGIYPTFGVSEAYFAIIKQSLCQSYPMFGVSVEGKESFKNNHKQVDWLKFDGTLA